MGNCSTKENKQSPKRKSLPTLSDIKTSQRSNLTDLFPSVSSPSKIKFKHYQVTTKNGRFDSHNNLRWGYALSQGSKPEMEDVVCCKFDTVNNNAVNFFAVYDGHSGKTTAKYVESHLFKNIVEDPKFPSDIRTALMNSYQKTDIELEKNSPDGSGATAVSVLVSDGSIYFANIGDSIAILSKTTHTDEPDIMSEIHRPVESNQNEINRILEACPLIRITNGRIQNGLAVSRAFGDFGLKKFSDLHTLYEITFLDNVVSNIPYTTSQTVTEDTNFCIMTSDGLTDLFSPKFLVKCVYEELEKGNLDCDEIADQLIQKAVRLIPNTPVVDNLSIIIIFFHQN